MPKPSNLNLSPLDLGKETMGERIARLRKERCLTQKQLAKKMGLTQSLISAYELNKLTFSAKMVARFAIFFGVTTDEIIGAKINGKNKIKLNLRLMKRIHRIEQLSEYNQKLILRMIDSFIRDNKPKNKT